MTNLEYAQDPENQNPLEKRTNPRFERLSIVPTDKLIRTRNLDESEVSVINLILKSMAKRYIAAAQENWLYPEKTITSGWRDLKTVLLPPKDELYKFGGETLIGYEDGSTYYQDAFGRTQPENKYLRKSINEADLGSNDLCGCGSGKKYKNCCRNVPKNKRPTWNVLSIRERNLIFYNGFADILGLIRGKDWNDIRRGLSDDQIIEIHKLYGSLWPIETDIFSLLPRPSNILRAVYTGMLDPRMLTNFALGSVPYFDELLIQHPFVNPAAVRPEYSPVESPHKYKYQTLKNFVLFNYLQPFIELGFVNVFPDPCSFDNYLHHQMLNMAEQRTGDYKINEKEEERITKLHKKDVLQTLWSLPKEQQMLLIRQAMPELSQGQMEEIIQYKNELNEQDPFALLQDDACANGGQLMMCSLAPNFEMALFLAQVTGSIIFTDSETRFGELKSAQFKEGNCISYPLAEISDFIQTLQFAYSANPLISYQNSINWSFGSFRKWLRDLLVSIQKNKFTSDGVFIERLKATASAAHEEFQRSTDANDHLGFSAKMGLLMPKGGFVHNNVQRLLLKTGSEHHSDAVPMAAFVEPISSIPQT